MGSGKSLVAIAQALVTKGRTCILTGLKGLQDQLETEFGVCGLVVLKGKSNYECDGLPGHTCDEGSVGKCSYKGSSMCNWGRAKQDALESNIITTNYSCWFAANKFGQGLGDFDLLICDESHSVPGYLAQALKITLSEHEIREELKFQWPDDIESMEDWKRWSGSARIKADIQLQGLKSRMDKLHKPPLSLIKDYQHFKNLSRKLTELWNCKPLDWVPDSWMHGYQFDPIRVTDYAEKMLFHGIPKVILTSGTIRPRTLEMLGIDPDNFDFFDYPMAVNVSKSPLYYIPTAYVNKDSSSATLMKIVKRIDEIVESRADRKGIIHTSNHDIRDFIMSHSQYSRYMVSNYSANGDITSRIVEDFKSSRAPSILVSASVTTGYDFPGSCARYQIIAKLPFPNFQTAKVDQMRELDDPNRGIYHMWQTLAQAFGRADRGDMDWQEVFVLDNNIEKAMFRFSDLAPIWLPAYYRKVDEIPMPMSFD